MKGMTCALCSISPANIPVATLPPYKEQKQCSRSTPAPTISSPGGCLAFQVYNRAS